MILICLPAALLTPADAQKQTIFPKLRRKAKRVAPTIAQIWVDNGYTGSTVADAAAKAGVTSTSCPRRNPAAGSSSSRAPRWLNAPTGTINHWSLP